jgi:hypothetical protein
LTTTNYVLKANGTTLGNSLIFDNGTNVGIGTTSPVAKLNIYGTSGNPSITADTNNLFSITGSLGPQLNIGGYNGASYGMWLQVKDAGNGGTLYPILLQPLGGNVGIGTSSPNLTNTNRTVLDINGTSTSLLGLSVAGAYKSYLFQNGNDLFINNTIGLMALNVETANYMSFATANTERMRITSTGQLQIKELGGTHATDGLSIINNASQVWNLVNGGDSNLYLGFQGTSKGVFAYTTGTYTPLSDINKKKDFEVSTIGLNQVLQLKPTLYRMKDEDETSDKHLGFIAQEVKEFIPQAYNESVNGEDTFIGLSEMPIIAALVKAIQEMNTKSEEQQALITSLQAQINAIVATK